MTAILVINGLDVAYAGVSALVRVSLKLDVGGALALIGANGAGKTTLLRAVSGLVKPAAGSILYEEKRIDGTRTHRLVRDGIAMVPEGRRIFPYMSVLDNLRLGAHCRRDNAPVVRDLESVLERFPRLKERRRQLAGSLSGGEQQMVALGRALMSRPRLLLLDEPSLGLAPKLIRQIGEHIRDIRRDAQVSLLLVEQNARLALSLTDYAIVLENGRIALEGPSVTLADNDRVRELYLGG
ncbi:MAG: ABC transporter ATP-binding protein [Pseudomonadota bacterium]